MSYPKNLILCECDVLLTCMSMISEIGYLCELMIAEYFTSLEEIVEAILGEHLVVPGFEQCCDFFHCHFNVVLASSEIGILDGLVQGLDSIFLLEMLRLEGKGLSGFFLGLYWLLSRLLLRVLGILGVFNICGKLIHLTYIIAKLI